MQDKIVLITGGNAGIGRATARRLSEMGAEVVLACRSRARGEAAAQDIMRKTGNNKVSVIHCDLASFDSIRRAAGVFAAKYDRLDVLINNAGVFTTDLKRTREGFELQFGVNHLGHFLLTKLLLDHLKFSLQPRIVNVSSADHYRGDIDFNNLRGQKGAASYSGFKAYCQSKLANVLFTRELARRHPQIDCNCLHPGMVRTRFINKDSKWYISLGWTLLKPFMASKENGAETSVYLATSPAIEGVSGEYFDQKQRRRNPSEKARDDKLARKLWTVSEQFAGEFGMKKDWRIEGLED
jgi:NAD(P)-dependent dehydrogenase (short-subunit alcohol dehydrogenase family)